MDNKELVDLKKNLTEQILVMSKIIEALTARLSLLEDVVVDAELEARGDIK